MTSKESRPVPAPSFEVGVEEVLGRPAKVYRDRMSSLREVFRTYTSAFADREHVVYGSSRSTFADVREQSLSAAATWRGRDGVGHGDRVAILSANSPHWMVSFWAATGLGAIVVGLNGWWKADEIIYGLRHSAATVLVADGQRFDRIADRLGELPGLRAVYLSGTPADTGFADPRVRPYDELLRQPGAGVPDTVLHEDDPAVIFYTSGTTGRPKGAVSTHRSLVANLQNYQYNAAATRAFAPSAPAGDQPVMLLTSPMFHVSGCHSGIVVGLASGARIVMPVGRFEPEKALALIERERVTAWPAVPTVLWRVVQQVSPDAYDTSSLRSVVYGGSPSAGALRRQVQEFFPSVGTVRNAYGLTESSSVAAMIQGPDFEAHPDSVGRPTPVTEVRIVDEDGHEAPTGQAGEVWLRGSTITAGYWNDPEATAAALTPDRWLRTGDIGRLDADGLLYLVDRSKDMIIRGGENVYCVEIENRLVEHPLVADAAVVGVPHPTLGEEVMSIVQLHEGAGLDAAEIRAWVSDSLADFKVPRHIHLTHEDLPRNASMKLMKGELRDRYAPTG